MPHERDHQRAIGRVTRLNHAKAKLADKLKLYPRHANAPAWRARIKEFDASIANFAKHGQETAPTGRPVGVSIDVGTDKIRLTDLVPGS